MQRLIYSACFASLIFIVGCAGNSDRPADLPKLYPVTITVTAEGTPVEKAVVEFVSDPPSKFRAIGTTNDKGIAEMKTYGQKGSPAGQFKVVIKHDIEDEQVYGTKGEREYVVSFNTYRTIDEITYKAETTPFEITVPVKSGQKPTFNVGQRVKVKR